MLSYVKRILFVGHGESAEIQGIHWQGMQQPRFGPVRSRSIGGKDGGESTSIDRCELPDPKGMVSAVSSEYDIVRISNSRKPSTSNSAELGPKARRNETMTRTL